MAQEPSPHQQQSGDANSRWDTFWERFYIILNVVLSGSSGRPRPAPQPSAQQEPGRKVDFLWGAFLGLLLAALNAEVLFLEFYSPDLGLFSRQSKTLLIFQYFLLCFLLFLFIGLLSGYITGQIRPIRRISITAGLISFISGIVVVFVFISALGGEEGLYLLAFVFSGEGILVGLLPPILCVGGGISGGLIGSRVLRPVTLRGGRWVFRLVLACLVIVELVSIALGGLGFVGQGPLAFLGTSVKEFSVPTPQSGPSGITTGPDGNLWFIESRANQIGRITPGGTITEFRVPTPESGLSEITAGPDGNLWFTEANANQIGRITPGGVITEFSLPTPNAQPIGITAGPDKNLWFTEARANQIGRITPGGAITEFMITTFLSSPDAHPGAITAGPDGNLWFTELNRYQIGRITPKGHITQFPLDPDGEGPPGASGLAGIAAGPDGSLWVTDQSSSGIKQIMPNGSITVFDFNLFVYSNVVPGGITAGPDGNLWFTDRGNNEIDRMTPTRAITLFPVPTSQSDPLEITVGPDGNLWFTEEGANQIGCIPAQTPSLYGTVDYLGP